MTATLLSTEVARVIEAATALRDRGLEMDARLDPGIQRPLMAMVEAVYGFDEAEELRAELETQGVFDPRGARTPGCGGSRTSTPSCARTAPRCCRRTRRTTRRRMTQVGR